MGFVPEPPAAPDPLLTTWQAGRRLYRVHSTSCPATAFNPGVGRPGRFHPIASASGKAIPTLYAADRVDGALSETVFHSLVAGGVVLRGELRHRYLTEIELTETLAVADLTGHGLRRLGLTRRELLECGPAHYGATARWAVALHGSAPAPAGLVWVSRQFDTSTVLVAFGDRLGPRPFVARGASKPLHRGVGLRLLQRAASAAGITVVEA